jgi:tRNA (cmo5U34)-methyltransferase
VARRRFAGRRVEFWEAELTASLPSGPFDLVVSALAVHHLWGAEKADLFVRSAAVLAPGGRFVLGDVVVPEDPADAATPLTSDHDRPDTVANQLDWLAAAGFEASVVWRAGDLVVLRAEGPG